MKQQRGLGSLCWRLAFVSLILQLPALSFAGPPSPLYVAGDWTLTANSKYIFNLHLTQSGGTLSGTLARSDGAEPTDAITGSIDSTGAIAFHRSRVNQDFKGTASGSSMTGTFAGGATWSAKEVAAAPSTPTAAPAAAPPRNVAGDWTLTASGKYVFTLHLTQSGGSLTGTLARSDGSEPTDSITGSIGSNGAIAFHRSRVSQDFKGTASGSSMAGTFAGGATWSAKAGVTAPSTPPAAPPKNVAGDWTLTASGKYVFTLHLTQSGGSLTGTLARNDGSEPTDSITGSIDSNGAIAFHRSRVSQDFKGTASGSGMAGTFAGGATWSAKAGVISKAGNAPTLPPEDQNCEQVGGGRLADVAEIAQQYFIRTSSGSFNKSAFLSAASAVKTFTLTGPQLLQYVAAVGLSSKGEEARFVGPGAPAVTLPDGVTVPASPLVIVKPNLQNPGTCLHEYIHAGLTASGIQAASHHPFIQDTLFLALGGANMNSWSKAPACNMTGNSAPGLARCSNINETCNDGVGSAPLHFSCDKLGAVPLSCVNNKCVNAGTVKPVGYSPPQSLPVITSACNLDTQSGTIFLWSFNSLKLPGIYTITCDNGYTNTASIPLDSDRTDGGTFLQDGWFYHGGTNDPNAVTAQSCSSSYADPTGSIDVAGSSIACQSQ